MTVFSLKLIGVGCMLLDHLAVVLFPLLSETAFYTMRAIGRISFPIFAFLLANGCRHTHNPRRYLFRLLLCGFASQLAYTQALQIAGVNVLFDLAVGAAGIFLLERRRGGNGRVLCGIGVAALGAASIWMQGYGLQGFLLMLIFYFVTAKRKAALLAALVLLTLYPPVSPWDACFLAGALAALVLLGVYNGQLGIQGKFVRYVFYFFYPLHLFLYWGLRIVLFPS